MAKRSKQTKPKLTQRLVRVLGVIVVLRARGTNLTQCTRRVAKKSAGGNLPPAL
jgi:hypothetical protein